MDKKQKVLEILKMLSETGTWDLANSLYIFVSKFDNVSEEILDNILKLIWDAIKNTKDTQALDNLKEASNILEKVREEERKDRIKEIEDSDKIIQEI